jgi:hypothetical protein
MPSTSAMCALMLAALQVDWSQHAVAHVQRMQLRRGRQPAVRQRARRMQPRVRCLPPSLHPLHRLAGEPAVHLRAMDGDCCHKDYQPDSS